MSFHSNGKITIKFEGLVKLIKVEGTLFRIESDEDSDFEKLSYLARYRYKIKTKKKRIVKKYISKLINESLRYYLEKYNEINSEV